MVDAVYGPLVLPVGSLRRNAVGWWGVLCLIATEACLFAYLLFSYYYFAVQHGRAWAPAHPSWKLAGPDTAILLSSSVAIWWAEGGVKKGDRRRHLSGTALSIFLGLTFLVVQYFEWKGKSFTPQSGSYGSLYFTITGFHMAHVIVGVIMLSTVLTWSAAGFYNVRRHLPVVISSAYWHFVDAVWVAVFFTFYVTPYLL